MGFPGCPCVVSSLQRWEWGLSSHIPKVEFFSSGDWSSLCTLISVLGTLPDLLPPTSLSMKEDSVVGTLIQVDSCANFVARWLSLSSPKTTWERSPQGGLSPVLKMAEGVRSWENLTHDHWGFRVHLTVGAGASLFPGDF